MLQNYQATVSSITEISSQVLHIAIKLPENNPLTFQAGQYLLMEVPGGFRQYSLCSNPFDHQAIEIVVDVTPQGIGSKYLEQLKLGDSVKFRAPLGVFTLKQNNLPKVFLATGAGIAPIRAMVYELLENKSQAPLALYWGLRTQANLYFQETWETLAQKYPHFSFQYCLSREENSIPYCFHGHIQDALESQQLTSKEVDYYLCGRVSTVENLRQFLLSKEIKSEHIFFEKFT